MDSLPDILTDGMKLRSQSGIICKVVITGGRNSKDELLFQLKYPRHEVDGFIYPAITGNGLWTRDKLSAQGLTLVEEKKTEPTVRRRTR